LLLAGIGGVGVRLPRFRPGSGRPLGADSISCSIAAPVHKISGEDRAWRGIQQSIPPENRVSSHIPRFRFIQLALASSLAAALFAPAVYAGNIVGVRVDPPTVTVGQQVQVTVDGQDEGRCGLRVEYGNGDVDVTGMREGKDRFPRSFMHTYAGPGTFTIVAKGGHDGSASGCAGEARVTVAVVPVPTEPPPRMEHRDRMERISEACPDGFALNRDSVDRRTGAFSCAALEGAQLPNVGIPCPAGTAYYTNTQGTMLGCKALRRQQ
jgi:hypothetical protein